MFYVFLYSFRSFFGLFRFRIAVNSLVIFFFTIFFGGVNVVDKKCIEKNDKAKVIEKTK